ncbi:hypothetical protein LRE75_34275 [Streptomyces sp. 372A]
MLEPGGGRVVRGCTWRVQQQTQILSTAILAFYNQGQVPEPVPGKPPVMVQDELDARKGEKVELPSGAFVPTTDAALAGELEQALRISSVHVHALMGLFQLTDSLYEQVVGRGATVREHHEPAEIPLTWHALTAAWVSHGPSTPQILALSSWQRLVADQDQADHQPLDQVCAAQRRPGQAHAEPGGPRCAPVW